MSGTNYVTAKLLDHLLGSGTRNYTSPTVYVALSSTTPDESGGSVTEPSGGSYARVSTAGTDWVAAVQGGVTKSVSSITRVGTTATATSTAHGYSNGDWIKISGATQSQYNGYFKIQNVTTNTFDYIMTSDPGGSATGSPVCRKVSVVKNNNPVTFPTATADWLAAANLTYFLLYDALTSGNALISGALQVAKPVLNGDTATFAAGSLVALME